MLTETELDRAILSYVEVPAWELQPGDLIPGVGTVEWVELIDGMVVLDLKGRPEDVRRIRPDIRFAVRR